MKQRLDLLLVERGLADTRSKAQALIMAGKVKAGDKLLSKAGQLVNADLEISLAEGPKYVSRAGLKLESVAVKLGLDFTDKAVLDVGASTGGFADYALQHGAAKVYAVDVGRAQLHPKLLADPKVVAMEQTDIRTASLPEPVDLILIDVSFIPLRKVLEPAAKWLKPGGQIVAMAKPQFEATKQIADRYKGVIKDQTTREQILDDLGGWLKQNYRIMKSADSEVAGAEGNIERFYLLSSRP